MKRQINTNELTVFHLRFFDSLKKPSDNPQKAIGDTQKAISLPPKSRQKTGQLCLADMLLHHFADIDSSGNLIVPFITTYMSQDFYDLSGKKISLEAANRSVEYYLFFRENPT
ncbi:MAG: hypothetical protein IPL32_05285 [Chloracidobacterium sp.]|nr:hypothetical protein [Chloracidobacterium sp.]